MDVWVEDVKNAAKDEQLWGLKLRDLAARAVRYFCSDYVQVVHKVVRVTAKIG